MISCNKKYETELHNDWLRHFKHLIGLPGFPPYFFMNEHKRDPSRFEANQGKSSLMKGHEAS